MIIKGLRTFLPSKDYNVSKAFYQDLGFSIVWENEELCQFGDSQFSFFLQDYYNKDWAENLMIQLLTDDLEDVYKKAEYCVKNYDNIKLKPIFEAEYGRTFHLIGPAGELWHMTESRQDSKPNELLCEDQ